MNFIYYKLLIKIIYFFECLFFKNNNTCPYCLKKEYIVVFKKKKLIDICYCLNCYLYWTNPIFKFLKFYDLLYNEKDPFIRLPKPKDLDNFINKHFNYKEKKYLKIIEYFIDRYKIKKAIDFGCSWGYFIYQLKLFGIDAVGIEISKKKRDFGIKKLDLKIEKEIYDLIKKEEKYDIIFSFHTLEHLSNISNIFNCFSQLLNKDGILVIEVPNLKKEGNFEIMGACHPLGFTKEFFLRNLPNEGFKVNVYLGYTDLLEEISCQSEDNLIIIATKI